MHVSASRIKYPRVRVLITGNESYCVEGQLLRDGLCVSESDPVTTTR